MADGVFLSGFTPDNVGVALHAARSIRPIHVNLCLSVRYGGVADDWSIAGDEDVVARRLRETVDKHRPDTIGIALVDRDPLPLMIERAVSTFATLGD